MTPNLDGLALDLRLAARQLRQRPLFAAVAMLTLSVGMGLNAVVFSAVNAVFLQGNAMSGVDGAAWITTTNRQGGIDELSLDEFDRFAGAAPAAMDTAALGRLPLAWQRGGGSETVWAQLVSGGYFRLVDTQPIAGRRPVLRIDGNPEAVIGERFWRQRLGTAPLTGLRLSLNGVEHAIVGVISERFRGPGGTFAPEVWTPLERWRELRLPETIAAADHRWLTMIGRIGAGVSPTEIESRVAAAAAHLAAERPATHAGRGARLFLMRDGHPELRGLTSLALAALAGTGMVLLLACFNLAGLLIARGLDRRREIGIRAAMGAGTGRLVRQLMLEGLLLSLGGGIVAALLAFWSQQLLGAFALPAPIPQRIDLSPDGTVLAFVMLLTVLAGVLPSLMPAVNAARLDLVQALTSHGGGSRRPSGARQALVMTQVAGSAALLTGAALFVSGAAAMASADPGFERSKAIVLAVEPALQGYDAARSRLFVDRLRERLQAQPGVAEVAVADRVPFYVGYPRTTTVAATAGQCARGVCPAVTTYAVGPDFFHALGIPMLAGREIDPPAAPDGIVVSEAFARAWWPEASAVDRVVYLGDAGRPHRIVGVARDVSDRSLTERAAAPILYRPLSEGDFTGAVTVVVRTRGPAGGLVRAVDAAARAVDPAIPLQSIETMAERLRWPQWPARTATMFFAVCGGVALLLAAIGLFAVIAHSVNQRTREFGVRIAVGATPASLVRGVLAGSAALVVPGTLLGLLAAALIAAGVSNAFTGIEARAAWPYLAVGAVQAAIALAAAVLPARRAARADPLHSLRAE